MGDRFGELPRSTGRRAMALYFETGHRRQRFSDRSDDGKWPGLPVRGQARQQSFDPIIGLLNGICRRTPRKGSPGHQQSLVNGGSRAPHLETSRAGNLSRFHFLNIRHWRVSGLAVGSLRRPRPPRSRTGICAGKLVSAEGFSQRTPANRGRPRASSPRRRGARARRADVDHPLRVSARGR